MKYKEISMSNVLSHAITDTLHLGRKIEKEDFHIALSGTADYIPHMGMVAASVKLHNKDLPLCFHFFINTLSDDNRKRLETMAQTLDSAVEVHLINDGAFKTVILSDGIAAFFYRLVAPNAVSKETDRLLYLDSDMMCCGSLKPLAALDLDDYSAAVVSDRWEEHQRQKLHTQRYFNSGMMLFNVKKWLEDDCFDEIVRRAEINASYKDKPLSKHDQDILNQMLDGKCLYIEKKYNYLYNLDRQSLFKKQPVNEDYHKQVIIHFAGHAKPWHSWVQEWPVVKEYAAIQKNSPWKDVPLVPPRGHKNLHQAARTARMQGKYGEMISLYLKYLGAKA